MASLNAAKLFDVARVAKTQAGKDVKEFIDYCNTNFSQVILALRGNLTFRDNIKSEVLTAELTHGQAQQLRVKSTDILTVVGLRAGGESATPVSFQVGFAFNNSGQLVVIPSFSDYLERQASVVSFSGVTVTVTTSQSHGLATDGRVVISNPVGAGVLPQGEYVVKVISANKFSFAASASPGAGADALTGLRWANAPTRRPCTLLVIYN